MYLTIEQIACGYGSRAVLADFSLTVDRGEFVAVVGPNGSGKSTLIKAISRALPLTRGKVCLDGIDIAHMRAREVARRMAVVGHDPEVEFDFTVEEVVAMGRIPYLRLLRGEGEADLAAVEQALTVTGALDLRKRSVMGLSSGERQRVMVARSLAQEPSLLLLDEPTAHLDIGHQVELLDLTRRLNRVEGLTVLVVLHDLNLASQYADRLVMIRRGQLVADGPPSAVITEQRVAEVYGARVVVTDHPHEAKPHVFLLSGKSK